MSPALVAVVQICSTADRAANQGRAVELVRRAAAAGAQLVALPEMWPYIGLDSDKIGGGETLQGPTVSAMQELAAELGIWLFPGTFAEASDEPGRIHNTAVAIDDRGELVGVYRKIHLFDAQVPGATFVESATVKPGDRAVVVQTPWGRAGMTVCYDLRFPALFADLRAAGADFVLLPSAFTARTGKDHWEVLVRARAIEQQVYILAPEQWGRHNEKRESHGQSMVVDPWGQVVAQVPEGEGLALAWLEPERVARVRARMPVAGHHRAWRSAADGQEPSRVALGGCPPRAPTDPGVRVDAPGSSGTQVRCATL